MGLSQDTDRALSEAKRLVSDNQNGGRHRLDGGSIGKGSARIKRYNLLHKAAFFGGSVLAIFVATAIAGMILNGIGFTGVMVVVGAIILAAILSASLVGKVQIPKRAELKKGNPKQMVGRVELWLEAQRSSLPAKATGIIDEMGSQLDALGQQLESMEESHPAMAEVRELVGEYIPETIDNYRKIPEHLRREEHAGGTADDRLVTSLTKLSGEIDRVTRRLAEGALDDLAVKSRYLEYRYGGDEMLEDLANSPDTGVPLPDFSATPTKQSR
ncbi:MAG: hypothetical protein AAF494_03700 [Pseudomonadota bacterium]